MERLGVGVDDLFLSMKSLERQMESVESQLELFHVVTEASNVPLTTSHPGT